MQKIKFKYLTNCEINAEVSKYFSNTIQNTFPSCPSTSVLLLLNPKSKSKIKNSCTIHGFDVCKLYKQWGFNEIYKFISNLSFIIKVAISFDS